jgi:hypothetical protein
MTTNRSDFAESGALVERARAASDLLELLASDRVHLHRLPEGVRVRLLRAAGRVSRPDALARRRVVKAARIERRKARVERIESVLADTGIRKLRRETGCRSRWVRQPRRARRSWPSQRSGSARTPSPAYR